MTDESTPFLSKKTKVSLTLATTISIVITLVTCTWKIAGVAERFEQRVTKLEKEHFTLAAAAEAALRFAIENPGMRVPDPRNPANIIQVGVVGRPH